MRAKSLHLFFLALLAIPLASQASSRLSDNDSRIVEYSTWAFGDSPRVNRGQTQWVREQQVATGCSPVCVVVTEVAASPSAGWQVPSSGRSIGIGRGWQAPSDVRIDFRDAATHRSIQAPGALGGTPGSIGSSFYTYVGVPPRQSVVQTALDLTRQTIEREQRLRAVGQAVEQHERAKWQQHQAATADLQRQIHENSERSARNSVRIDSFISDVGQSISPDGSRARSTQSREIQNLKNDPLIVRRYHLNEIAVENIKNELRENIERGRFTKVADLIEALKYNANQASQSDDFEAITNDSGVLLPERVRPQLGPSPLGQYALKTPQDSEAGHLIRRTANRLQAAWAEGLIQPERNTSGPSLVDTSAALILTADQYLSQGQLRGTDVLKTANILLDFATGAAQGLGDGVVSTFQSLPDLGRALLSFDMVRAYSSSAEYAEAQHQILSAVPQMATAMAVALAEDAETLANGTSYERGQLVGRIVSERLMDYATGGTTSMARAGVRATRSGISRSVRATPKTLEIWQPAIDVAKSLPPGLRSQLTQRSGLSNQIRMEAVEAFVAARNSKIQAVQRDAEAIARVALEARSEGAANALKAALASTGTGVPDHSVRYLNSVQDARRFVSQYEALEDWVMKQPRSSISGWEARNIPIEFAPTRSAEEVFHHADVLTFNQQRYGIPGPNGVSTMSVGFGPTEDIARLVSEAEMRSYGNDPASTARVTATRQVQMENVLDLTAVTDRIPGGLDIAGRRNGRLNYEATQIIGHVANRNGFSAILAPSAAAQGQKALHHLRGQR